MKARVNFIDQVNELVEAKEVSWLKRIREGYTREQSYEDLTPICQAACLILDKAIIEASR